MGGAPSVRVDPGKLYEPVQLVCKIVIEPEIVLRYQRAGGTPHHGSPIGKMSDLFPFDQIKRRALSEAQTFMGHMKTQGYELVDVASSMEFWGPFREKPKMDKATSNHNFEAGNPLIPQGHWGSAAHGITKTDSRGPQVLDRKAVLDKGEWQEGAVFFIRGQFLATRSQRDESTGTHLV